jgi:hypothetical protein
MNESLVSSDEKASVFGIELQHGRENVLCWGGFEAVPVSAGTARQERHCLEGTLFSPGLGDLTGSGFWKLKGVRMRDWWSVLE